MKTKIQWYYKGDKVDILEENEREGFVRIENQDGEQFTVPRTAIVGRWIK